MAKVARAVVTLALVALPATLAAHDIPVDVAVQAFVKPEGRHLTVLVRVPLESMRDIDYPKRGAGYIDLSGVDRALREAAQVWISNNVDVYEGDTPLAQPRIAAVRVSSLGDPSFTSYERARALVTGPPLPADANLYWNQGLLDALFEYDISSDQARFSVNPRLGRLGAHVVTALRLLPPGGAVRAFELIGDPGLVPLDPRWSQAARRFAALGFEHILSGHDHLLFLLCLVIPLRRMRPLVAVVTAFTVAHSVTLIASAYDLGPDALWFPPLIETLIAASIVSMALENIAAGLSVSRRWLITFGFGLVHGFGFSFALKQTLQFAGSHLLTALLSFNAGVELGQLLVLAIFIPALHVLFRFVVAERMGTIILSAIVAHTAWHWMIDRGERLRQYAWPTITAGGLAAALRGLMVVMAIVALGWVGRQVWPRKRTAAVTPATAVSDPD